MVLCGCSKCCACHAKRAWGAPSAAPATQNEPEVRQVLPLPRKTTRRPKSPVVTGLPLTSMKVLQVLHRSRKNEPEVLLVLRMPRKTSRRCSKCCACHAKRRGAQSPQLSPDFRWPLWRWSKCCACHAKRAWGAPSAAPATQNDATPKVITRRRTSRPRSKPFFSRGGRGEVMILFGCTRLSQARRDQHELQVWKPAA